MFALVAVCAALALTAQSAQAQHRPIDRRLTGVSIGVGAAATAGYFAINGWKWKWNNASGLTQAGAIGITTLGCAAVAPMVATVVLNRPLTMREGHVMVASCIIPIIGGWLVEQAYDAHPEWEPASAPVHHRKTRAKKM
jgi:hypothetical protein